tara:strand:- start:196 stop:318 length:123 start_codon:yes stop_codon:yes gene_type:complete
MLDIAGILAGTPAHASGPISAAVQNTVVITQCRAAETACL